MDSGDEFSGVYAKNVELAVIVYPGLFTDTTAGEFSRRSQNDVDISDFENMDPASSDDETLIIDPDILADLNSQSLPLPLPSPSPSPSPSPFSSLTV